MVFEKPEGDSVFFDTLWDFFIATPAYEVIFCDLFCAIRNLQIIYHMEVIEPQILVVILSHPDEAYHPVSYADLILPCNVLSPL